MSGKGKVPGGYTNKTLTTLQNETQQLLFELGQMHYNEQFSIRRQDQIQDRLNELEQEIAYARRQEDAAARAKAQTDSNKQEAEQLTPEPTETPLVENTQPS